MHFIINELLLRDEHMVDVGVFGRSAAHSAHVLPTRFRP